MDGGLPDEEQVRRHGGRYTGGKDHFAVWNATGYSQRPGREFENGLMKSLCALLGCTKTRTAPLPSGVRRDD